MPFPRAYDFHVSAVRPCVCGVLTCACPFWGIRLPRSRFEALRPWRTYFGSCATRTASRLLLALGSSPPTLPRGGAHFTGPVWRGVVIIAQTSTVQLTYFWPCAGRTASRLLLALGSSPPTLPRGGAHFTGSVWRGVATTAQTSTVQLTCFLPCATRTASRLLLASGSSPQALPRGSAHFTGTIWRGVTTPQISTVQLLLSPLYH